MGTEENLNAVQQVYEAFGRGDIPAVIEGFADDILWSNHTDTGLAGVHHGRSEVGDWFANFAQVCELERFDIDRILCEGDTAVVLVDTQYTVKATGKTAAGPIVQVMKLRDGKIYDFREYEQGHSEAWK